ncbi:MAG: hypothetical protein MUF34_02955 [Polyangiaceae bacterium]|jgi:hypothetical protein|nr:hypothetical protein [Polyangiaceae bacterium]
MHQIYRSPTGSIHRLWRLIAVVLAVYVAACAQQTSDLDETGRGFDPQSTAPQSPGAVGALSARSYRLALRDTTAAQVHLWNVEDGQITDRTQTEAPPGAPLAIGDLNGDRHDDLAFYGETGEAGPFIGNFKSFPSVRPVIGTTILEPGAPIKGHIGNVTRPLGFPKSFLTPAEQTTP